MQLRSFALASLALLVVACGNDKPLPPAPAPDRAAASAAPVSSTTSAASAAVSAPPSEAQSAEAKAESPQPLASATSSAAVAQRGAPRDGAVPHPKSGILAPGEADKLVKIGDRPIVKVLDAGAEPRAELAYAIPKGSKASLDIAMDISLTMKQGKEAVPEISLPRMTIGFETTAADAKPDDFKIEGMLGKISVDAGKTAQAQQLATALKGDLDKMKGLSMTYWLTSKGATHDVKIDLPAGFPPQAQQVMEGMNQSLGQMTSPLPKEPIGVGAKWQVVSRANLAGQDVLLFSTYTMKSKEGDAVKLDISVTQLAANERVTPPNMPPGFTAKLTSFVATSTGSTTLDLASPVPREGAMSVKTSLDLDLANGADKVKTSAITTLTTTFTRSK